MLSDVRFRLKSLFRRRRVEEELADELRFHFDQQVEKLTGSGVPHAEAVRRARLMVGGIEQVKEECREARGVRPLEVVLQDLRYGLRILRAKPVFTLVAVLTLTLGVGATTAIFSIVNAVLLRSLPFPQPDRLVRVFFNNPGTGLHGVRFSVPELNDLRNRAGVFENVSAEARGSLNLTGGSQPRRLEFHVSTAEYFSVLGVAPKVGRLFGPGDFTPGAAPSTVISDSLWRTEFAGDPNVLGRTIHLDSDPYTIVGVLPPGFRTPGSPRTHEIEVWIASGFSGPSDAKPIRSSRAMPGAIGRLKAGLTLAQAQARLTAMAAEIRRDYAADYPPQGQWTIEIQPLQESFVRKIRPMLLAMLGSVLAIVLIVSLNIANLLLARASGRQQEMAVRSALGASRERIVSQMLTESVLLSFIGGSAGVALAFGSLRMILRVMPTRIPRLSEVNIDWTVLLFALCVSVLTGLVFGLAPALHAMRSGLAAGMREGGRGIGYGVHSGRLRDALVVAELALAVVLMVGAGLLVRTLQGLLQENPGFNPTQVVAANVNLPYPDDPKLDPYRSLDRQISFYRELRRRMNSIPGVKLAAFVSDLPAAGTPLEFGLRIEDRPTESVDDLRADDILVTPDYFRVMETPLVRGRFFSEGDEDGKLRVAIVDESTASRYWPDHDAVGRRLRLGQGPWITVVGVVKDIKHNGLDTEGAPHVYVPMYQAFDAAAGVVFRDFSIVLRTPLTASTLEPVIRQHVQAMNPGLPVYDVAGMNELLDRSLGSRRFSADVAGGFAVVALLLAAIGIYGVLAFMAGQRSREIGVRVALGAGHADILRLIVSKGVVLAVVGISAGVVLAAGSASLMASLLYGVRPHDPQVFISVPLVMFVVAILASWLPARRATKVDPITVLREA